MMLGAAGCTVFGGARVGLDVVRDLRRGMRFDEAIRALADGGAVRVEIDIDPASEPRPRDWRGEGEVPLERAGRRVARSVEAVRLWGFLGLDNYDLYFDGEGRLIDWRIEHVN